jgi:hypothetical protein
MAYRYGIKNVYRPTQLISNAYGWTTAPQYNRADVPTALMQAPTDITADELLQQFAYEWFQSGSSEAGLTNPPFVSGAAGRLLPFLTSGGAPARILRGYIRRAQFDAGDTVSKARLYFMYNPEVITRDYVSYLDQGAIDPFNTIYQSGNDVAPPSILDFSFDLFFDRQEEAVQVDHPGVFVDYQFFDLVVRNVVPSNPNQVSNTLPDNGVMMVNPRDITVVFSPQFTVQGRPLNARVSFEKFTHRMTPTRMRISLTMRAVYIGPVKDMTEYRAETFAAQAAIPYGRGAAESAINTMTQVVDNEQSVVQNTNGVPGNSTDPNTGTDYNTQQGIAGDANSQLRASALNWAKAHVNSSTIYVGADSGSARWNLPASADCSGLVTAAFKAVGVNNTKVFGSTYAGTTSMLSHWRSNNYKYVTKFSYADAITGNKLQYGDILIRPGHVSFFDSYAGDRINIFSAEGHNSDPQVGAHSYRRTTFKSTYIGIRVRPIGSDASSNATNNPNAGSIA